MTNKREPGYYWVLLKNNKIVIAEMIVLEYDLDNYSPKLNNEIPEIYGWMQLKPHQLISDKNIDEIGSRITPEMRYTEEDMKQFANFCYNEELTNEINFTGKLNDWLKQKKNEK